MSVTYALAARALTALFNQYLFSFFFVFLKGYSDVLRT